MTTATTPRLKARYDAEVKQALLAQLGLENVMLVVKGKPTRVGYKVNADGTKVRIAKKTGEEV